MKDPRRHRRHGKIIEWDWDWINSLSHENECPYYLTEREVGALLTFMDTMGWLTRWVSPTEQAVSLDFIEALRDGISDKLMRDDDCPADPCEDGCIDYLPNSSFIRYEPNDPFRTPLLVPLGYTIIPWYTNALIAPFGVLPTDAMVNQLAVFGYAIPLSGFPRFSFEFDGRGEVEIELVNVPAGGFCLVVTDESPLNFKIVNTSSNLLDVVSIAGILAALGFDTEDANIVDTDIIEIEIPDVGHHRIDVTFLPNFGGETLLGFGGGLRRVTLCGPTQVIEEMYLQRQSPEDDCLIEQSTDGGITWQEAWRMDNCCDDNVYTRYTDEGIMETSPDGETWTPNREDDPRFNPPTLPPLPGTPGEGLRCEAANNVTGYIHAVANDLIADSAAWSGVTYILSALLGILFVVFSIGSGGALSPLLLALAGALLSTGSAAFSASMTSGVYQTFVCIVYCNTPENGLFTEENWQAIKAGILSELTGIAAQFLHDNVNAIGIAGLNNASRTGINEGLDCDECPCDDTWCYLFDFGADDEQEWTLDTTGGYSNGTFQTTSGWRFGDFLNTTTDPDSANRLAYVKRALTASTITKVTMTYKYIGGTFDTNTLRALIIFMNGVDKLNITRAAMADGDFQTVVWEGTQGGVTELSLWLRSSRDISSPYNYGGDALIRSVQIEGTGNNPFGTDNCP